MGVPVTTVGIFVGGASRRMGGAPKGLLPLPGPAHETLVARAVRVVREAGLRPVFIGHAPWLGDVAPDVPRWTDRHTGIGPMGGLATLLAQSDGVYAIALACDMPYVTAAMLARLASVETNAAIVAPRMTRGTGWEALCARYHRDRVSSVIEALVASRRYALQAAFDELPVEPLLLGDSEAAALRDWDAPSDVERGGDGS